MGVDLGKNLLALLGSTARTQAVTGHTVARTQAPLMLQFLMKERHKFWIPFLQRVCL